MAHARLRGRTVEETTVALVEYLERLSNRHDWQVLFEFSYWRAACEDYELPHYADAEKAAVKWAEEIAERLGVRG